MVYTLLCRSTGRSNGIHTQCNNAPIHSVARLCIIVIFRGFVVVNFECYFVGGFIF